MRRNVPTLALLAACTGGGPSPAPAATPAGKLEAPAAVIVEEKRWPMTEAELRGEPAEPRAGFDFHSWCNRFGRFASCKAKAITPDGKVAIVAASDSPSTCLRDRACGRGGGWGGALARLTFASREAKTPEVRTLIEHDDRKDFVVAASSQWLAALEGTELSVWSVTGDGPPVTATIAGAGLKTLGWVGDRYLVGTRWLDTESAEIVVLDREAAYAPSASWVVEGTIQTIALRPGSEQLAIGTNWWRARTTVEVDEKRLELYTLDGTRRARVDLPAVPMLLTWSSDDTLVAALAASDPADAMMIRYKVAP